MIVEHPDTLSDWESLKAIKTGGTQSADTAAMEAYYDAIDGGMSKSEAGEVFNKTYQKHINNGKETLLPIK